MIYIIFYDLYYMSDITTNKKVTVQVELLTMHNVFAMVTLICRQSSSSLVLSISGN